MRYIFLLSIFFFAVACHHSQEKKKEIKIDTPLDHHLSGDGSKTIVFIHGWCINQTYWNDQVSRLKKNIVY